MSEQFEDAEDLELSALKHIKPKETERRVFAIFYRLSMPGAYVSEVGQEVLDTFSAAWNELTTPAWGDRAIYWAHVPVSCMDPGAAKGRGADRPYILNERRAGWFLLMPDDLTVLRMEIALAGETFTETSMRDGSSWFIQMADRLTELRAHDRDGVPTIAVNSLRKEEGVIEPTTALQYAISILPRAIAQALEGIVLRFQTTIQAQKDEIGFLKNRIQGMEELEKKRVEERRQKEMNFLQGGVVTMPRPEGTPRQGEMLPPESRQSLLDRFLRSKDGL